MKNAHASFALLLLLSAACAVSQEGDADPPGSAPEAERWSSADNPGLLDANLERRLASLPAQGRATTTPWAGNYWPAFRDSINAQWAGPFSRSPTQKYAAAFRVAGVEDRVSRSFGIDAHRNASLCFDDSQCAVWRHEVCGGRAWQGMGRCIPHWLGICDGWASAAILFPEPRHAVVMNGVTFRVQDIKALLSLVQIGGPRRGVSLKCLLSDDLGGIRYDAAGRPTAPECRDTNPGTFHIVIANYLGLQGRSLVEDRTFDAQVWNQPLRGYEVLAQRQISAQEANALVAGGGRSGYPWNRDAQRFAYVKTRLSYIKESRAETDGNLSASIDRYTGHDVYDYVLELDAAGTIIGGEWVGSSKRNHPDFMWLPTGAGSSVAGGAIRYQQVASLAAASVAP